MAPLTGTLVLDFSTLLPGPMATLLLADAGAEVIKIERPGQGDEMRTYTPRWGNHSVNFALLNRGKQSLVLDLKSEADRDKLLPLLRRADVLIEQFRPGVMDRLGLGYEAVRAINPRTIYCAITGYGQSGPKRDRAGHDLNYIGDTGLLALSMGPADAPVVPPALIADIAGGAYPAVMNVLLALKQRDQTGEGCFIDVSMADNLFPFMYWAMGNGLAAGRWPGNGTDLVTGGTPRYRLYPTADERVVAAAPIEQRFWNVFCEVIGLEETWRDDAVDSEATARRIAEIIRRRDAEHWRAVFDKADCCCTIVATIEQAMHDPHFRHRGLFERTVTDDAGSNLPALSTPIAASLRDAPHSKPVPELGENFLDANG